MTITQGRLTAKRVERLKTPGRYLDGRGLILEVREGTHGLAKSWTLRYALNGRTRWLGLGSAFDVSLKKAREKAAQARELIAEGIDPVDAKHERAARQKAAVPNRGASFAMVAADYFNLNQGAWRSAIHRQQWESSIERFANPVIGAMPVAEIGTDAIQQCLGPLWSEKPVAAQRLRGRIERVLDFAAARGLRPPSVANPAAMRCVSHLLPKTRRTKRHFAAVSVSDVPLLMAMLAEVEGIAARALEFTILTCVRTNETLGALWSEFDLAGKTWTIPPERTRSRRVFRVPLAEPALRLIGELPRAENSPYVFAGESGRPLGRLAMLRVLRRLRPGATTHGFRSCFADWAAEHTSASYEAREGALCHSVGSDVERAYRRGDLLDLRRGLAEAWGSYLTAEPSDVVVPLRRGGGLQ